MYRRSRTRAYWIRFRSEGAFRTPNSFFTADWLMRLYGRYSTLTLLLRRRGHGSNTDERIITWVSASGAYQRAEQEIHEDWLPRSKGARVPVNGIHAHPRNATHVQHCQGRCHLLHSSRRFCLTVKGATIHLPWPYGAFSFANKHTVKLKQIRKTFTNAHCYLHPEGGRPEPTPAKFNRRIHSIRLFLRHV